MIVPADFLRQLLVPRFASSKVMPELLTSPKKIALQKGGRQTRMWSVERESVKRET